MLEIIQLGPLIIRTHLLLLLVGIVLGASMFLRLANRESLRLTIFVDKGWWFILAFLLGGRLLGMLILYRVYVQDPVRIFIIWDGIFNLFGGLMGLGFTLLIFTWRQRAQFLKWLDIFMPAATLMIGFDWLGKFFGALSYGRPTDAFWGVALNSIGVRYTVPIHPVQLYYALWFFALTIILIALRKRKYLPVFPNRFSSRSRSTDTIGNTTQISLSQSGIVTLIGLILSFLGVIFLEFYRGDFAITVFAKLVDFVFLGLLFASLGTIAVLEGKISHKYSLINSVVVGMVTMLYLLVRPWISIMSIEWRFSQFLSVLAILAAIVYVVAHRWKYPHH